MRRHLEACPECAALYQALQELQEDVQEAGQELPVPPPVAHAWRSAVRADAQPQKNARRPMARWPRFAAVAAALVLVVGLSVTALNGGAPKLNSETSLSASYDESADVALRKGESEPLMLYNASAPMAEYELAEEAPAAMPSEETGAISGGGSAPAGTMLEKRAWYTLSTQSFEADAQKLKDLATSSGGWIESESQSGKAFDKDGAGRSLSLLLRVPSEQMEPALEAMTGIGVLEYSSVQVQDVSEQYYDTAGRLQTAQALQTQLQALLEKAEDVEVLAELTRQLSDNQWQIDSLQGSLQGMERRVQYSRIDITLNETRTPTLTPAQSNRSLGARIRDGLIDSLRSMLSFFQDASVWVIAALPWLLLAGLVILVIILAIRRRKR